MTTKKQTTIIISLMAIGLFGAMQPSMAGKKAPLLSDAIILKALMKNQGVLLKNAKYCNGVTISENDHTIGDYLSGFWAFHANKDGNNWLDINVSKSSDAFFLAKVMIYRKSAEDNWGWGVSFKLDKKANVKRSSFTCLGSG